MSLSQTEVKKFLQACHPAGTENYLDWDNSATNVGQHLTASAGVWKTYGTDIIDTLRQEISPTTIIQKIPDWEAALGLTNTPIAKFGTTAQRRNAILGWLRQTGTFSIADIQAICAPFFLYADPSQIQVIDNAQASLFGLHTYAAASGFVVPGPGVNFGAVMVPDDPTVSPAGAILFLVVTCTNIEQLSVSLYCYGGFPQTYAFGSLGSGSVNNQIFTLHFPQFAGQYVGGNWVALVNCNGAAGATIGAWSLYVEGVGVNYNSKGDRIGEGLGSKNFEWAVVADPALLGTGYDLGGALKALRRMKPAHTQCYIALKDAGGGLPMIWDNANAIWDAAVWG